jgi:hypothetical protein
VSIQTSVNIVHNSLINLSIASPSSNSWVGYPTCWHVGIFGVSSIMMHKVKNRPSFFNFTPRNQWSRSIVPSALLCWGVPKVRNQDLFWHGPIEGRFTLWTMKSSHGRLSDVIGRWSRSGTTWVYTKEKNGKVTTEVEVHKFVLFKPTLSTAMVQRVFCWD